MAHSSPAPDMTAAPKRALITGGARRLGRAMALYLAQRGFDVAVHYASSHEEAQDTVAEIRALGREAVALQADLLDESQTETLVPRASTALGGPITLLVNNASIFERDCLISATRDSWDRHMESNLRAPFVLIQHFAAALPAALPDANDEPRAQGLVVNMVDQRVRNLTPDFASYTIAKMGLWALTQTAAQALAPHARVNAIGPGPTLKNPRQRAADFAEQRGATILKRGADPQEITTALGYFIDAPGVTGQLICVDGGQHLNWRTPDNLAPE